jgi:hypothetical protein
MRYLGRSFPAQDDGEECDLEFDFALHPQYHRNDGISSATWAIEVDDGTDASVADRLIGSETHQGLISSHRVGELVDAVRYKLTVTATMLSGATLVLYSYVYGRAT